MYRFKMAAKWPIFISRHFDFGQNLKKKHFPKGIFQLILARSKTAWTNLHCWNKNWFFFPGVILKFALYIYMNYKRP